MPRILNFCKCGINGLKYLSLKYVFRYDRKIDSNLQYLFKVVATWDSLFTESLLNSNSVERQQIDDVWKRSYPRKVDTLINEVTLD